MFLSIGLDIQSRTVNLVTFMEREEINRFIQQVTGADRLMSLGVVQRLWSGYGSIERIGLEGTDVSSVIVKHVKPGSGKHPRGWNGSVS